MAKVIRLFYSPFAKGYGGQGATTSFGLREMGRADKLRQWQKTEDRIQNMEDVKYESIADR